MKTLTVVPVPVLAIFVVLALIAALPTQSSAATSTTVVHDLDGQPLRAGTEYYILPVFRGRGGGVTMGKPRNGTCPLAVVQDLFEVSRGMPVRFYPVSGKKGEIRPSTDMNIQFSGASICVQSTVWKLGAYDDSTGQRFVATGGVKGNPGIQTISNWFKIEELDKHYKLLFCPTVCNTCKVICRDVGIYIDGSTRRLALSDDPFKIAFKKA